MTVGRHVLLRVNITGFIGSCIGNILISQIPYNGIFGNSIFHATTGFELDGMLVAELSTMGWLTYAVTAKSYMPITNIHIPSSFAIYGILIMAIG